MQAGATANQLSWFVGAVIVKKLELSEAVLCFATTVTRLSSWFRADTKLKTKRCSNESSAGPSFTETEIQYNHTRRLDAALEHRCLQKL